MIKKIRFITNEVSIDKDINLLPESHKREILLGMRLARLLVLAWILFSLTLAAFFAFLYKSEKLRAQNSIFIELLSSDKYTTAEQLHSRVEVLKKEIDRITSLVNDIDNPKFITKENLEAVLNLLPKGVFLQTVSITTTERRIIFEGVSDERAKISVFADSLNNADEFTHIELKSLISDNNGLIYFKLAIYFK